MADTDPTQTGGQEEKLNLEEQIAAKVNAAQAADRTPLGDEDAEVQAKDEEDEPAPAKAAPVEPEPAPVKVTRKVKVYGQEEEVDVDKLIEHGIRDYQKDRAADIKLQQAALKLQQAEQQIQQLQGRPPQGADQQPTATPQPDSPPESLEAQLERVAYNRDANRAGSVFRKDFPDIAADPHLMNMAWQLEQQRLQTTAALGEPYGDPFEAYREHGETIRKWVAQFKPVAPPVAQDKIDRKRTITAVPAVNAKAPQPQEDKPQTMSEIIAQERKARQGRPVPQRSH